MSALLAAMKSSTDSDQLAALGQAYAATAAKLDEKGASEAVSALLAAMKSSRPADPWQLAALGHAYAAAAAKLDEKEGASERGGECAAGGDAVEYQWLSTGCARSCVRGDGGQAR
ncbi:hypothetical protein [Plasticicumulans sp.]|uniref:hypothetical protein n=1 Tax=Plasticicumulans sp. TaxID=2307179 RepID=UPI003936E32B